MADENPIRHDVLPEDSQRLARLSEEVRGRLAEIALIMGRVTGEDVGGGLITKFVPREGAETDSASSHGDWMEIIAFPNGQEGCHGSIGGHEFISIPC
jgi:hypothetical protein